MKNLKGGENMTLSRSEQAKLEKIKELRAKEESGQDVRNEKFQAILGFAIEDAMTQEGLLNTVRKLSGTPKGTPEQQYMNVQASAYDESQVIKNLQNCWKDKEV